MEKSSIQATVKPENDLIGTASQDLRRKLQELLDQNKNHILVDMSNISLIDSSGIGVIIGIQNILKGKGGSIYLKNVSADIMKMFSMVHIDKHITILQ